MKDSKKLKYELQYSPEQRHMVEVARDEKYTRYGNIDDLDPKRYNENQMYRISVGRGDNDRFSNIDHLQPENFSHGQMYIISRKGSIDD